MENEANKLNLMSISAVGEFEYDFTYLFLGWLHSAKQKSPTNQFRASGQLKVCAMIK